MDALVTAKTDVIIVDAQLLKHCKQFEKNQLNLGLKLQHDHVNAVDKVSIDRLSEINYRQVLTVVKGLL